MLLPHRSSLSVVHDDPEHFYANCARSDAKGKAQFFCAIKVSGRKHLFHFMPVYDFPELIDTISPALKKRMQGKSCFNFDTIEPPLMTELSGLVKQGANRYKAAGKL
ncbi:hypothetical protein AOT14_18920 [Stenotrophomonas acidaminiphila]|uniref:DUF1801 domain-containing protein n=1 Tax=Stenotrophomonas acidaminiphila TaxID=128780 RepID=A0A0S1AZR0_9GAMM|nr:hypothetical protein AOT14_18920 [Stenotrophomonas acidaminiphila]